MDWVLRLSLIQLFAVYLTLAFLLSTAFRVRQYWTILSLVFRFPGRWPRLFQLVKQHRDIFLTWGTVGPLFLSLCLLGAHLLASHLVWPEAAGYLTIGQLLVLWPALPLVVLAGAVLVVVDFSMMRKVSAIDRGGVEKYFDQAEYWLRSWTAPVVRFFTLGFINPRRIVAVEVRAALVNVSEVINTSLWWMSVQTGARLLFGLALWGTYVAAPLLCWLVGAPPPPPGS
jgi:hypothetical protein